MNAITRGARNALRSPVRSGAIVVMLAISIGLVLAMLVARASVNAKIAEVKASVATKITINPAGMQGGMGGGDPLTAAQIQKVKDTPHITGVTSNLTDQLGEKETSLTPSFELGKAGKRMMRFESGASAEKPSLNSMNEDNGTPKLPAPRTSVTGTDTPEASVPQGKLTSGGMIDGNGDDNVALIGKALAEKNKLSAGDTFTAYGEKITVKGIYEVESEFQNNGVVMPLATLQRLTGQTGAVTQATATADSSDNVANAVSALKKTLSDKADITSQQEQAENSVKPLKSIAALATAGVFAAAGAGAVILLLAMVMVVRERRREIGVIKAIGATNTKVIAQFVSEAVTLTVIAGIIGLALGTLASGPLTQSLVSDGGRNEPPTMQGAGLHTAAGPMRMGFSNITSTLTPETFATSAGVILLIAVVGSAVPAYATARVRPAEVLRTE